MTSFLLHIANSSLRINISPQGRASWKRLILYFLEEQLNGFSLHEQGTTSSERVIYEINLKDYAEIKNIKTALIVPGSYGFQDGVLIDYQKLSALAVKEDSLSYWHDLTPFFSIHYLIQLALLENKSSFVHSAGLTYKGAALVFPAFGGIGKTLLMNELLQRDFFKLLGDDLVIVSSRSQASAYPRPFCIYEYHIPLFKNILAGKTFRYLWPSLLWRIYQRLSFEMFCRWNIPLPRLSKNTTPKEKYILTPPKELFGEAKIETESCPINWVFWLVRSPEVDCITIGEADLHAVSSFATDVTRHEWDCFEKTHLSLLIHQKIDSWVDRKRNFDIINSSFSQAKEHLQIRLPMSFDIKDLAAKICSYLEA